MVIRDALLDGEANRFEAAAARRHIASCSRCRADSETTENAAAMLAEGLRRSLSPFRVTPGARRAWNAALAARRSALSVRRIVAAGVVFVALGALALSEFARNAPSEATAAVSRETTTRIVLRLGEPGRHGREYIRVRRGTPVEIEVESIRGGLTATACVVFALAPGAGDESAGIDPSEFVSVMSEGGDPIDALGRVLSDSPDGIVAVGAGVCRGLLAPSDGSPRRTILQGVVAADDAVGWGRFVVTDPIVIEVI